MVIQHIMYKTNIIMTIDQKFHNIPQRYNIREKKIKHVYYASVILVFSVVIAMFFEFICLLIYQHNNNKHPMIVNTLDW